MPIAGKTTFIRMLHGSLKPDDESIEVPEFRVSYKPQKISPKFPGSVRPPPVVSGHTGRTLQAMHAAGSTPAACTWPVAVLMLWQEHVWCMSRMTAHESIRALNAVPNLVSKRLQHPN